MQAQVVFTYLFIYLFIYLFVFIAGAHFSVLPQVQEILFAARKKCDIFE
jgi:hypothetical protein